MESEIIIGRRAASKEDRRRSILAVAERSFFERGYAATSMSTIAAELGGSKTTLWNYYPGKEALFLAVLDGMIADFGAALDEALVPVGGTAAALGRFGRVFLAKILSPGSEALKRLMACEAHRFPTMAVAFFDRGPGRVRERLRRFLGEEMARGRLRPGDAGLAARQFLALCQAGGFNDRFWHCPSAVTIDIGRDVADAVETFLRAWGGEAGSSAPKRSCSTAG